MRRLFKLVTLAVILISLGWFYLDPGPEPILSFLGAVGGFIATCFSGKTVIPIAGQAQTVSHGSTGIQAGGDVRFEKKDEQ